MSVRIACITRNLAVNCGLQWSLSHEGVKVAGSPDAIEVFRSDLYKNMADQATLLMCETATISTVISVLSCLTSLEELCSHLRVSSPKGGSSGGGAILRVLEEWFTVQQQASQEELVRVLNKMERRDLAQRLALSGVSGTDYCKIS